MPEAPHHAGDVVAQKYRLERLVGEGAMGRVFRARHLLLGSDVAIKFLHEAIADEGARARFVREAKAAMALKSDHVVRVFDLGISSSGIPYMVLEYLEGTDLRSLLRAKGKVEVTEAVDYVLQVCEGLAEAHVVGIIHRDLKPQNLFLTRRPNGTPCVKVLDFGISKFSTRRESADELTMSNVMIGSPVFVPPEQIRDARNVDARADVWSLGVVLYMLLGGGRPFDGEGVAAVCASIMVDEPRPLSARCPNVPPELEAIILRCLAKRREERIQSVAALARELQPFATAVGRLSAERVLQAYASMPQVRAAPAAPAEPPRPALLSTTDAEAPRAAEPTPPSPDDEAATIPLPPATKRRRRHWVLPAGALALTVVVLAGLRVARAPAASAAQESASASPPPPTSTEVLTVASAPDPTPPPSEAQPAATAARPVSRGRPSRGAAPPPVKPKVDRNGVPIIE